MRDILFRGKRIDNGEWIEGYLCKGEFLQNRVYILPIAYVAQVCQSERHELMIGGFAEVDPATVGEYTGLKDRDGKWIFEGDIVKTKYGRVCKVTWFLSEQYSGWDFDPVSEKRDPPDQWDLFYARNLTVLGNIHDNPELLRTTGADIGYAAQDVMMPAT